ncbi:Os01g0291733, partial [Oryza sativa Japonica Group]
RRQVVVLDALRHDPGAGLGHRRRADDGDGHERVVREGYDVRRRPPPVVRLQEPQPRPVGDEQGIVREAQLVRILPEVGHRPPREVRRQPRLRLPYHPHHPGHVRRLHRPALRHHRHRVEAVAVEPIAAIAAGGGCGPGGGAGHEVAGVGEEAEVDAGGGFREAERAGARLPRLGDGDVEGGAAVAGGGEVGGLGLVDAVQAQVGGDVAELEHLQLRRRARGQLRRARDGLAGPDRAHPRPVQPAGVVAHRVDELPGP